MDVGGRGKRGKRGKEGGQTAKVLRRGEDVASRNPWGRHPFPSTLPPPADRGRSPSSHPIRKASVHWPLGFTEWPIGEELCRQPLVGAFSKSRAHWSGGRDLIILRGPHPRERAELMLQSPYGPALEKKESLESLASVKSASALFSPSKTKTISYTIRAPIATLPKISPICYRYCIPRTKNASQNSVNKLKKRRVCVRACVTVVCEV